MTGPAYWLNSPFSAAISHVVISKQTKFTIKKNKPSQAPEMSEAQVQRVIQRELRTRDTRLPSDATLNAVPLHDFRTLSGNSEDEFPIEERKHSGVQKVNIPPPENQGGAVEVDEENNEVIVGKPSSSDSSESSGLDG